ncbi:hypothetical protein Y1Q_0022920 [Alligator mississippiensis]|uniref:Uncharacterized protein n=1 Tax=Alligator mississippiensis TaxID=8496 RepID=A0A151MI91_ALLMI|nr:hypothetical protein Y1Q_0022920 [Alligator mississippiensis]
MLLSGAASCGRLSPCRHSRQINAASLPLQMSRGFLLSFPPSQNPSAASRLPGCSNQESEEWLEEDAMLGADTTGTLVLHLAQARNMAAIAAVATWGVLASCH